MTTFLFSYRMPKGYVLGRPDAMAAWTAWFEEMGTSVGDPGNPVFESVGLGNCGDGTRLGGYSLITAEDLDTAISLAKGCPALQEGAGVEVGVITELDRGQDGSPS
jgi:YCII-related domain